MRRSFAINSTGTLDILESLYKTRIRASDQLKTVLALYEQEIEQHHSPSEVEDRGEEMNQRIRARNFVARNERIEMGVPEKLVKGNLSLLRGSKEKAEGRCTARDACSFRRDVVLSCSKTADSKRREIFFERENSQRSWSLWTEIKDRAKATSVEIARIRHVIFGIFPTVNITKTQSNCNFGEKWVFMHTEVDSQPDKKPKKTGGKKSVAPLKNSTQLGCVFQDVQLPKSNAILRKGTKSLGPLRSVQFSKGT